MKGARFAHLAALSALMAMGLSACGPSTPHEQRGIEGSIELPALAPGDTILLENEQCRIVEGVVVSTDSTDYNQLHVQQKTPEGTDFTLQGTYLSLEHVIGNTLVLSEGTGGVRNLRLHDARTGELRLALDYPMASIPLMVEEAGYFSYYRYDNDAGSVAWDKQTGIWNEFGILLPAMRNEALEEAKASVAEYLFDGFTLMAHQRVRVNAETLSVELLNEYKWGYAE